MAAIRIISILLILISCSKKNLKIEESVYYYFDINSQKSCKISSIGILNPTLLIKDSIELMYYRNHIGNNSDATIDRGKLIYSFCNYGKLVFDSLNHKTSYLNNIDSIKYITPSSKVNFYHALRENVFVVEPYNDSIWRIREVRKAQPTNIKQ